MRRRIFWSTVGVAAVAVLLAGVIGAAIGQVLVSRQAREEMARQGDAARAVLAEQLGEGTDAAGLLARLSGLRDVDQEAAVARVAELITTSRRLLGNELFDLAIVDRNGRVTLLAGRIPDPYGLDGRLVLAGEEQFLVADGEERLLVYARPLLEERRSDTGPRLAVVVPRRAAVLDVAQLGRAMLIVLGLVTLLAAVAARYISRSVAQRLDTLADAARALAAGDTTVRADASGNDEVAVVSAAFNDMADELDEARLREREFLVSVGHDLRTPLTTIAGYAEMLADGGTAPAETDRIAKVLGFETARLRRLVEDLMQLATLEAREFTLHPEPVDVTAHVGELAEGFRPRARHARITLEVDLVPTGLVTIDPDRLAQVTANLLENALRYTPEAGTVRLSVAPAGDGIAVTVTDSGGGIDPADLPHVFERFYVARRYRRVRPEGSGLGLAIVKQLADAMGGTVAVSSVWGGGTTVTVGFPTG